MNKKIRVGCGGDIPPAPPPFIISYGVGVGPGAAIGICIFYYYKNSMKNGLIFYYIKN